MHVLTGRGSRMETEIDTSALQQGNACSMKGEGEFGTSGASILSRQDSPLSCTEMGIREGMRCPLKSL